MTPCISAGNLTICAPTGYRYRTVRKCPNCKARRRVLITLYQWYDASATCCYCGDSWSGGEYLMRPAVRGWRAKARVRLQKEWMAETRKRAEAEQQLMDDFIGAEA